MRNALRLVLRYAVLLVAYVVLFLGGIAALGPEIPGAALSPAEQQASGAMSLLMSAIDVGLIAWLIHTSRLRGGRLMLLVGGVYYFVKTFTSQLEAAYFMKNLTPEMMPGLFAMTLPVAVLFPPLAVWLLGRARRDAASPEAGWEPSPLGAGQCALRTALLSAVVYPALFFTFGYYVAFASPEVRAFYGFGELSGFVPHMASALAADPVLYPFEVLRGLLWVAAGWLVLRTTRGTWWARGLLVAAWFAILQNDVHLLPNPLMPETVRLFHFAETASSNALNALAIAWALAQKTPRGTGYFFTSREKVACPP